MPQSCDPISGFERILRTFGACHVKGWLVLALLASGWHGVLPRVSRESWTFSGGGADCGAGPASSRRTFWLFCWKLVRVWYLFSLCLWWLFSDCPKWTFFNWSLVFFSFATLLRNVIFLKAFYQAICTHISLSNFIMIYICQNDLRLNYGH